MSELTTRLLDPYVDGLELLQLFEDTFGATVTPQMWQWKYMPPWIQRYYCWIARTPAKDAAQDTETKVIGYAGAVPLPGQVHGERMLFFQLADFMVHPAHRRKHNLFDLCVRHILDDIVATQPRHVLYGFSNHRAFLWMKKLGVCDVLRRESTRFVRSADVVAKRFAFCELDWEDPAIDALWARLEPEFPVSLVRDRAYLGWRYRDHPVNHYRILGMQDGGELVGWAVVANDGAGLQGRPPELPVVDLLAPRALLGAAACELSAHLAHDLMVWVPPSFAETFGEEQDSGTNVYHFTRGSAVTTAALAGDLYYTMGDVDWW